VVGVAPQVSATLSETTRPEGWSKRARSSVRGVSLDGTDRRRTRTRLAVGCPSILPESALCFSEGVGGLRTAKKRRGSSGATFAEGSPAAVRLAEWAAAGFAGGRLFKSDAHLPVFSIMKGHVVTMG
jgi:hypothetical protein